MEPSLDPAVGQESPIVHSADEVSAANDLIAAFAATYPFPLDDFQRRAMIELSVGNSVLVAAPTGTGKTVIAEFAIWQAIRSGKRVFYTAPLKALSNQKFRDFRARYGVAEVGLMTGDIVENAHAPIVVMTTEIYRNVLLELERVDHPAAGTDFAGTVATIDHGRKHLDTQLSNVACVIFDELHYMADPQRGPVWEECIIHSPPQVGFVGLSATVHNARDLVEWMSQVHGPTKLIFHPDRAVPLEDYFYFDNTLHLVRNAAGERVQRFPHVGGERKLARHMYYDDEGVAPKVREAPTPAEVLVAMRGQELLPCLYFLPGRKAVEDAALNASSIRMTTVEEQRAIAEEVREWLTALPQEDRDLDQVQTLASLLPRGIAFHHAGLLPSLKMLVEMLFARGSLLAVFATDTLAMGVNMPARSVIMGSLSKFDGIEMRLLTPNEYQQLTGRAGRRGMDEHGAAVILYSPWEAFEPSFKELTKALLPVKSAFSMRYNSVLNLWRPNEFERLREIGAKSFLEYQRRLRRKQKPRYALKGGKGKKSKQARVDESYSGEGVELGISVEHELLATATVLRTLGYIGDDDHLTQKGRLLRAIFHPAGVILTEMMLSNALDGLTSGELAEVVSWFVYDSDKPIWSQDTLTDRLRVSRRAAKALGDKVRRLEMQQTMPLSPAINEHFMGIASGWAQGISLAGIRQRISLAEGDLLMVLNQTIDLLRQLESATSQILDDPALWTPEAAPELSWMERRAMRQRLDRQRVAMRLAARQLLHGTVAQSRTLPFRAAGLPTPPVEELIELTPPNEGEF